MYHEITFYAYDIEKIEKITQDDKVYELVVDYEKK